MAIEIMSRCPNESLRGMQMEKTQRWSTSPLASTVIGVANCTQNVRAEPPAKDAHFHLLF